MQVPYFRSSIGEEEIQEVVGCIRSGWLTTGPKARMFEEQFAAYIGDVQAVSVNSATAGLHLALEAVGVRAGDEVIVPTYTFTATAEVVRYLGADPVFVDVDRETLCIDFDAVQRATSSRTRAIMPVHFGGYPIDLQPLIEWAGARGLSVIEDAAHAFPASRAGTRVGGAHSAATVFSFYANKTITTGEGGMVVTRSPELAARCRTMRLHGIDRDAFARFTTSTAQWRYDIVAPGFKYNLTDIAASIGLRQLEKAEAFRMSRERLAERYRQGLRHLPLVLPPRAPEDSRHAWHLFCVRLLDEAPLSRDECIARLHDAGIGCSVHYVPLHLMSYWRDTYRLDPATFPVAQDAFERVVSLPIFPSMTEQEIDYVVTTLCGLLS